MSDSGFLPKRLSLGPPRRQISTDTAHPPSSDFGASTTRDGAMAHFAHESDPSYESSERVTSHTMPCAVLPSYVQTLGDEAPPYVESSQTPRHPLPGSMEYEFHLKDRHKIWATLKLVSRNQPVARHTRTPCFVGGDGINGAVELDSGVKIRNISLRLKGRMVPGQLNTGVPADNWNYNFLDYTHSICSSSTGGTRDNQTSDGPRTFPFSFSFPTSTSLGSGKSGKPLIKDCPVPQTFTEKGIPVSVKYELSLIVDHGALRLDSKLYAPIVYMPKIVPPPASDKRQLAYQQGTSLPSPFDDPDGWHPSSPLLVTIRLRDGLEALLDCNLFLAHPLSYMRGTVLPLFLRLWSLEPRISDLVSDALDVRLVRRIKYYPGADRAMNYYNPNVARNEDERTVGKAVWWPQDNIVAQTPGQRWLAGEIHLGKDLQPSCGFIPFTIEYAVKIMPCVTDNLSLGPTSSLGGKRASLTPLLSQAVQIASIHEHGPLPISFTESGSESFPTAEEDGLDGFSAAMIHLTIHNTVTR